MFSYITTVILGMAPVLEIRAAVPFGVSAGLSPVTAFLLGFLGNAISVFLLLWYLEPVSIFLRKHFAIFERFFSWLFARTRIKHAKRAETLGELALFLFVSVPLPVTGGWAAAAIVFVFGLSRYKSLVAILSGVFVAGLVVSGLTQGIASLF